MIGVDVNVKRNAGLAEDLPQGVKNGMMAAADKGFRKSQEEVPHGATNTLAHSGKQPTWVEQEHSVFWGYGAPYADDVERGTDPHWVPIGPLKKWARRVLGDEQAAYPVQQSIAAEGTDAQPFVEPGFTEMKRTLEQTGLKTWVERER